MTLNPNASRDDFDFWRAIPLIMGAPTRRGASGAIVETSPNCTNAHARPPKRHFASDPIDWFRGDKRAAKTALVLDRIDVSPQWRGRVSTRISPG